MVYGWFMGCVVAGELRTGWLLVGRVAGCASCCHGLPHGRPIQDVLFILELVCLPEAQVGQIFFLFGKFHPVLNLVVAHVPQLPNYL